MQHTCNLNMQLLWYLLWFYTALGVLSMGGIIRVVYTNSCNSKCSNIDQTMYWKQNKCFVVVGYGGLCRAPSYLLLTSDSLAAGWNSGLISRELLCSNYWSESSEMRLNNCPLYWLPVSFYVTLFSTEIYCPSTMPVGRNFTFWHSSCLLRPFTIQICRYIYVTRI